MTASGTPLRELTARDVMSSPVVALKESNSVLEAANLMVSHQLRHVVVVTDGRCVGVLTDRDLLEIWYRGPSAMRAATLRYAIANRTACVLPEANLQQVADVMNVNRVDAVPVVDPTGTLLGLITAGDVVHAVAVHGVQITEDDRAD